MIASISAQSSTYQKRACTAAMMSFPNLPSQPSSGYQQRTAQPSHGLAPALAPSPESTVFVKVRSFPTMRQGVGGHSERCQHFAEVCTSTYKWMPISTAYVQKLGALNIPVQVTSEAVPSGNTPSIGNGPKQRYVFKSSSANSRYHRTSHTFLEFSPAAHSQHRLRLMA